MFSKKNFKYWLNYKNICIKNNFNLGFLRTENKNRKLFSTDLIKQIKFQMLINNIKFAVNNVNNYCAFWIYDKKELNKFIKTNFWRFKWKGKNMYAFYGIREMSAVGWHGKNMSRYKATVIPLVKKNYTHHVLLNICQITMLYLITQWDLDRLKKIKYLVKK